MSRYSFAWPCMVQRHSQRRQIMSTQKHTDTSKQQRQTSRPDSLLATSKIGVIALTEEELERVVGGDGGRFVVRKWGGILYST